jgi:hypothetical protein
MVGMGGARCITIVQVWKTADEQASGLVECGMQDEIELFKSLDHEMTP